jgi:CheY-like chemotaxis protein
LLSCTGSKSSKKGLELNGRARLVRELKTASIVLDAGPILVVDDDADIRESLAEILTDEGYSVRTFANGAEALAHLRRIGGHAALIILDLMMPVMSGWTFREEQSHDERLASIPVIAISAVGDLDPPSPETTTLCKPVNLDVLLDHVAAEVQHHHS